MTSPELFCRDCKHLKNEWSWAWFIPFRNTVCTRRSAGDKHDNVTGRKLKPVYLLCTSERDGWTNGFFPLPPVLVPDACGRTAKHFERK